ncbi:hypothetical protein EU528_12800 [Candidatus Thorarchaeota archaeon]|nr:MAG: hypothetical protein EU528_12800 [Candidatus Thorarchaeota archaeon]
MGYLEIISILGISFLLFRIWIVEYKLKEELKFRRRYFSRFFAYYTCLALAFGLAAYPFNIMVIVAFPILIVTSVWDVNFYRKFNTQEYWAKKRKWAILERITLHPPVVVVAIYIILNDARNYIQPPNLVIMVAIVIILFSPFFLIDERWTKRYQWPQALIVIGLVIASGVSLLLAEAFLWGVPIW